MPIKQEIQTGYFSAERIGKESMILKDILPTSLLMHDIRVYVGERLVHDDSFSKRWITFTRYKDYEVIDITSGEYEVTIYLGEEMKERLSIEVKDNYTEILIPEGKEETLALLDILIDRVCKEKRIKREELFGGKQEEKKMIIRVENNIINTNNIAILKR